MASMADFQAASKKAGYQDYNQYAQTLGYKSPAVSGNNVQPIGAYMNAIQDGFSKMNAPAQGNYNQSQSGFNYQTPKGQYDFGTPPDPYQRSGNNVAEIEALAKAQSAEIERKLRASADSQLASINQSISAVQPRFDEARQMTATDAAIAERNFARFLADRGISNTGATGSQIQSRMMQDQGLQGATGALNRQQQDITKEYDFEKFQTERAFNNALASGLADISLSSMQKQIEARQLEDENKYKSYRDQMLDFYKNAELQMTGDTTSANLAQISANMDEMLYNRDVEKERDIYGRGQDAIRNNREDSKFSAELDQFTKNFNLRQEELDQLQKQREYENSFQANREMGYVFPVDQMTTPYDLNEVAPYANDYQKEINRRLDLDATDPMIPKLQAARLDKLRSNPDVLRQYGDEYRTVNSRTQELQQTGLAISNEINKMELAQLPEKHRMEIAQIQQALEMGELQVAEQMIRNSYLPEELKTNIMATKTQMEVSRGQLAVSQGQLALGWAGRASADANAAASRNLEQQRINQAGAALKAQQKQANYADVTSAMLEENIAQNFAYRNPDGSYQMTEGSMLEATQYINSLAEAGTIAPSVLNGIKARMGQFPVGPGPSGPPPTGPGNVTIGRPVGVIGGGN